MNLHFEETNYPEPTRWFQLYADQMPLGIFYPTQFLYDYCMSEIKTMYGLDVEIETTKQICDELIRTYDENVGVKPDEPLFGGVLRTRTRLEIGLAIAAIEPQLRKKLWTETN